MSNQQQSFASMSLWSELEAEKAFVMWFEGEPAAAQCEGCTFFNGELRELSKLHARDVTYAE
jgi:hypothetical protein